MILDDKDFKQLIDTIILDIPQFIRVRDDTPLFKECDGWIGKHLSEEMITRRRRNVRNYILPRHPESKDRIVWSKNLMRTFLDAYDIYFYDSQLQKRLNARNVKLDFGLGDKNKVLGYCRKNNECFYEIHFTPLLLGDTLFSKGEKSYIVNGVEVFNHFDYFQSVFEHELAHLINNVFCPDAQVLRKGVYRKPMHGPNFKALVYASYHQTEIKGHLQTTEKVLEIENKRNVIRELSPGDLAHDTKTGRNVMINNINRKKAIFVYLNDKNKIMNGDLSSFVPLDEKYINDKNEIIVIRDLRRRIDFQNNVKINDMVRDVTTGKIGRVYDVKRTKVQVMIDGRIMNYPKYLLDRV